MSQAVLEVWSGGVSPGHWKDIIGRCSTVFANYKQHPLATAIHRLNIRQEQKGFGADVQMLIQAKNDFKHDRGPITEEDVIQATGAVQVALRRCMEALAFFTQYPVRQVFEINMERRSHQFRLKCLRYTGDHPALPQEEIVLPYAVHRGDLYMEVGSQQWVSLYPFIAAHTCPRCKARETFFIDKWNTKKSTVYVKSFERGHSEEIAQLAPDLADWTGTSREAA